MKGRSDDTSHHELHLAPRSDEDSLPRLHVVKVIGVHDGMHSSITVIGTKEGNVLFNDALNTFCIYGNMVSDIW